MRRSWLRLFWAGVLIAAAGLGYLVSSGLGERLLHREIEIQLSRRLGSRVSIEQVETRWEDGLWTEALGFEAYPSLDPDRPAALRARRVLAGVDLLALLIGRLELSDLVLEGPHLRIERRADGSFPDLPIPARPAAGSSRDSTSPVERGLRSLESLDTHTAALLDGNRLADRIELRDGTVQWVDHLSATDPDTPFELRLELVQGVFERDWLSDALRVDSRAIVVDGRHAPFPIELAFGREEGADFEWTLELANFPLALTEAELELVDRVSGVRGSLHIEARLARAAPDARLLELKGAVEDLAIDLRQSESTIDRRHIAWDTRLVIRDQQIALTRGRLDGSRFAIDLEGTATRPIRPSSRARIETRVTGLELHEIRELAVSLEGEYEGALLVSRLTDRVEEGRILSIQAAGTARLERWQAIATGRSRERPEGFLLGAGFEDLTVRTGPDDRLEDLQGSVEWVGDQLALQNFNATQHGRALPELNATVDGVSHLLRTPENPDYAPPIVPPLPGLVPFSELIKPRDPTRLPPVSAIGLAIDQLYHPLFRYPVRDLRIYAELLRGGLELNLREGRWGSASIEGEVVYFNDPTAPTVSASVVLGPPPPIDPPDESNATAAESGEVAETDDPTPPSPASEERVPDEDPDRWASGRFEIEFRPRPKIPFERARGFFRIAGSDLQLNEIEADVDKKGQVAARAVLALNREETVGLDLSFALTDGDLRRLCPAIALPENLATGVIQATGSLEGELRPDQNLIAELDGKIRTEARDGKVRSEIPLILRLSRATEGYNPFANEDELHYEAMNATLHIEQGKLSADDFEIEGPLRIFANARIDTTTKPADIKAVVGIFLFRASTEFLENLPLVRSLLPGSDRGLIGAYFEVEGPLAEPRIDALPLKTLMSSVPSAIKAPFRVLRFLFDRPKDDT